MKRYWKEFDKEKGPFKTVYCWDCKQVKTCGKLSLEYCCSCAYKMEQEKAEEYSDYQQIYQRKEQEQKERFQQYQLLKNYEGCKKCGSKAVDGYSLYQESKLVCQPCRLVKEDGASSPISFSEQSKWYKRRWKIELVEWLETYNCLPVNAECARKWLKDKRHLKNHDCLKSEAKELHLLFANSLKEYQEKLKECQCESSEKVRVDYLDSAGSGWTYCEKCEARIESAGHHGVTMIIVIFFIKKVLTVNQTYLEWKGKVI